MSATLSLLGLYQYNPKRFDGMKLPADVDKNTLVDNLVAECAEFEILYSDPFFLANMISVWSEKELKTWEKLAETLKFDYDPISNYDRKEEWTDINNETMRNSESGTSKNKENGTSKENANSNGNTNGTDTKKVAGYNSGSLVVSEENTTQVTTSLKNETTGESVRNFEAEEARQFTNETNGNNKRTGRAYGNIGVTTTQQMIEEERRVVKFNITDYIIDSFKRRFCLLIY